MSERRRKRPAAAAPAPAHVFGVHACRAVLEQRPEAIRRVRLLEGPLHGALGELESAFAKRGLKAERLSRSALDALADGGTHQGVIVEVRPLQSLSLPEFEDLVVARGAQLRLLVLDQVEDPRNLGACLRSAAAAGIDAVVVPKDRSAPLSPAAIKAAAGAAELVPVVRVTNLARTLRLLREAGVWITGAAADAPHTLYEARLSPPVAMVLGSEGAGLRRLTRELCDEVFAIPMRGAIDSLNVSVTAGIVVFESIRRD